VHADDPAAAGDDAAGDDATAAGADIAEVVVVGDGPAGAAAAAACAAAGLSTLLVGSGEPWTATYGLWCDDVPWLGDEVFAATRPRALVHGARTHELERAYGILDGAALRTGLLDGIPCVVGHAGRPERRADGSWEVPVVVGASGGDRIGAATRRVTARRAVVSATGSPPPTARTARRTAWQTAYGVVLDELPAALGDGAAVTLMDFREPGHGAPDVGVPTFGYVVPVANGRWLVEETVLAAHPAVEPERLRARLVARLGGPGLGEGLVAAAEAAGEVELVRIPMGGAIPRRGATPDGVVPFGAAAGLVHPATGYSVAASLRLAPVLAEAIAAGRDPVDAVWTADRRRARALHEFGLDVLVGLDADATRAFFDAFFDQPVGVWRDYLRVDTTTRAVSGVMWRLFRSAPWSLRRRLMAGDPRRLRVPTLDDA
jgi:lycopene beta-cyclase